MKLMITDELFKMFDETVLGVLVVRDLNNIGFCEQIMTMMNEEVFRLRSSLSENSLVNYPQIVMWREAYKIFGAKPKKHFSSIENLLKRILKGNDVANINTLVNIYNLVSLKYILPVGGENLDAIRGDVLLTIAGDNEKHVKLLGDKYERPPHQGEVIYRDDIGSICRRWNWKESERTMLTEETQNAILVTEGLRLSERAQILEAINYMSDLIAVYCGGTIRAAILDKTMPSIDV